MIYLSSTASRQNEMTLALAELAGRGVAAVELTGGCRFRPGLAREVIELGRELGVSLGVHNYFPPPREDLVLNLAARDRAVAAQSLDLARAGLAFARQAGCPLYGVHAGYTLEMSPQKGQGYFQSRGREDDRRAAWDRLLGNLHVLWSESRAAGARLAVENMFPLSLARQGSLLMTPGELDEFMAFCAERPGLGLLLDLGHLQVSGGLLGFDPLREARRLLAEFPGKIFALHLSANRSRRDEHLMNRPDDWQVALAAELLAQRPEAPVTLEWHGALDQAEFAADYQGVLAALQGRGHTRGNPSPGPGPGGKEGEA